MKKTLLIILVAVLVVGGIGIWFLTNNGEDTPEVEDTGPQNFPARFDDTTPAAGAAQYSSEFNNLAFAYPNNWNVTEGAENSAENQLLTVESPYDENEFYFCLDLHAVADGSEASFAVTDAEVLATSPLESGQHSVIYRVEGLDGLQWGVSDEAVAVGDTEFTSEISGQSGNRVQVFGRFDCRKTESPDISTDEFQNSQWFHEAKSIVESLEF